MASSKQLHGFSWSSSSMVATAAGLGIASAAAFWILRHQRLVEDGQIRLSDQTAESVANVMIGSPQWVSSDQDVGCRFWYKVRTGAKQHAYVLAEVSLEGSELKASRSPLFNHVELSTALGKQAKEESAIDPKALALEDVKVDLRDGSEKAKNEPTNCDSLWLSFQFKGRSRCWGPLDKDGEVAQLSEKARETGRTKTLRSLRRAHQRTRDGGSKPIKVRFENKTSLELEVFWMSYDGVRRSYGRMKPGGQHVQSTFNGHVWLIAIADAAKVAGKDQDSVTDDAGCESSEDGGTSSSSSSSSEGSNRRVSWAQKRFDEGWLGTYEAEGQDALVQVEESVLAGLHHNQKGGRAKSSMDEGLRGTSSLHVEHVLMRVRPLYGGGRWICDNCRGEFAGASWHCALCTFDLCVSCWEEKGTTRSDLPRFPIEQLPAGKTRVSWASDGQRAAWVEDGNVHILACEALGIEPVACGAEDSAEANEHRKEDKSIDESQIASFALTTDGAEGHMYEDLLLKWAPDSSALVAVRVEKPDKLRRLHLIESSPPKQFHARLRDIGKYIKPGDPLPRPKLVIFSCSKRDNDSHVCRPGLAIDGAEADPLSERTSLPKVAEQRGWDRVDVAGSLFPDAFTEDGHMKVQWAPDSKELYIDYVARDRQLFRVVACDRFSGAERTVWEELSPNSLRSFIDCTNDKQWWCWLHKGEEILYLSECDGYCHLYIRKATSGKDDTPKQLTRGSWVVRKILKVQEDEKENTEGSESSASPSRGVWFLASGCVAGHDPYYQHLCWTPFDADGHQVEILTKDAHGTHVVDLSPCKRFFVDTWSRVDLPPVTQLRCATTGVVVLELEKGDASKLLRSGYTPPVRFSSAGRDGQTQIYGVVFEPHRPGDFWNKKVRVVEDIYSGPHGAHCPKSWSAGLGCGIARKLAAAGLCVVILDGMGTNFRGSKFLDVAWQALNDQGFPDRKCWIRAAAARFLWMDLTDGIGIYGGSAGGQAAMRALLDHGDLYRVAVADCGCHDNRLDKIWWNEQWMGPQTSHEGYKRSSNVADAHKLEDCQRLLLVVGELDRNVDPSSTLRVVGALQQAGKHNFELCVIVGHGHGAADTTYGNKRRHEFLLQNLQPRRTLLERLASWSIQ